MPPLPLLGVVMKRRCLRAFGACPLSSRVFLHPHINAVSRQVQLHFADTPGIAQSQQRSVKFCVFHLGPPKKMSENCTPAAYRESGDARSLKVIPAPTS